MKYKYTKRLIIGFLFMLFFIGLISCGSKKQPEKAPLAEIPEVHAHQGEVWIVDTVASYQDVGKKHQICSLCGENFNETEIPSLAIDRLEAHTDVDQDELRPHYELGICRQLIGNPVVVLFFVDDYESKWTKDDVLKFTEEEILPGLTYLTINAKEWDVALDFTIESYAGAFDNFDIKYEGVVNPDLYNGGSSKDVLDKAAEDIGCKTNWDLYSYYQTMYPKQQIIFLNFLNKPGKSYARNFISTGYLEYAEHAVIFSDQLGSDHGEGKAGSSASRIVHELLHLFGAEDYYLSGSREDLANKKYPNDIMLWQYDNIQDNTIGDYTAFTVGWTHKAPDVCYDKAWWK
ncbi:MAG: hypothetical protein E7616_01315 [Ruminococcaceae bacterium]|nr:hypothetical protein [Oscillospiraceae bacterium]